MKTPFTAHFSLASIPLTRVQAPSFKPRYPMDYVLPEAHNHYVSDRCQLTYRWHDGFDVFVAELEVRFTHPDSSRLEIPIESHLSDLHLVYQQAGDATFLPAGLPKAAAHALVLPAQHHMEVYAPPSRAIIRIQPDHESRFFILVVVVPKGDWLKRHPQQPGNRWAELIHFRQAEPDGHRYVGPTPASPLVQAWVFLLLTLPAYSDMDLDNALNGPMVKLLGLHRDEYVAPGLHTVDDQRVEAARYIIREWVCRMADGKLPGPDDITAGRPARWEKLNDHHKTKYGMRMRAYVLQCRLLEAKDRLRGRQPISSVAYALGWTEACNFSRDFKRAFGESPKQFIFANLPATNQIRWK